MKTSPLQLDEAYIVEILIKESGVEVTNLKPSDIRVQADPKYAQSEENPLKWEIELSVVFGGSPEKPTPYEGRVISKGFFTISDTLKEETQKHIVAVNSPAMLFAATREIVANLTSRGRYGKMLLPSITFIDERKRFDPPAEPDTDAEMKSTTAAENAAGKAAE